jgi:hypothetical protein
LVYADDVNSVGKNLLTINKSTEALLIIREEVNLEACDKKMKYMFMFCQQNTGQNYNIKIANQLQKMWQHSSTYE